MTDTTSPEPTLETTSSPSKAQGFALVTELLDEMADAGQTPPQMLSPKSYFKRHLLVLLLVLTVAFFSVVVVVTVHEQRKLFHQHQVLLKEAHALEVERGQLMAELGTWAQNNRVDGLAAEQLEMFAPAFEDIEFIK
ncbi:MAG: cell division protein FtsL [Pontibacterium sp.]